LGTGAGAAALKPDAPPSGKLEAYQAYLQGRFYDARGNEQGLRQGIEQFALATRLDAKYALAWAWLGRTRTGLAIQHTEGAAAAEEVAAARIAVDTALALAPDMAYAHTANGYLLNNAELDWRAAEVELRRAVELAPGDGEAVFEYGNLLAVLGQV